MRIYIFWRGSNTTTIFFFMGTRQYRHACHEYRKEARCVACAIEKLQFIKVGINLYIHRKIHNILGDKHAEKFGIGGFSFWLGQTTREQLGKS